MTTTERAAVRALAEKMIGADDETDVSAEFQALDEAAGGNPDRGGWLLCVTVRYVRMRERSNHDQR